MIRAWRIFKDNPLVVLLASVLDVVFALVLGFLIGFFIEPLLQGFLRTIQQISGLQDDLTVVGIFISDPMLSTTISLLGMIIILGIFAFIAYVIVEGTAWFLSYNLVLSIPFGKFITRFAKISIPFLFLFAVYFFSSLLVDLRYTLIAGLDDGVKPLFPFIPFYIYLAAIMIFAAVSYSVLGIRRAWRLMREDSRRTAKTIVVVLALFAASQIFLYLIGLLSDAVMLVLALILLPSITFYRIYLISKFSGGSHDN